MDFKREMSQKWRLFAHSYVKHGDKIMAIKQAGIVSRNPRKLANKILRSWQMIWYIHDLNKELVTGAVIHPLTDKDLHLFTSKLVMDETQPMAIRLKAAQFLAKMIGADNPENYLEDRDPVRPIRITIAMESKDLTSEQIQEAIDEKKIQLGIKPETEADRKRDDDAFMEEYNARQQEIKDRGGGKKFRR